MISENERALQFCFQNLKTKLNKIACAPIHLIPVKLRPSILWYGPLKFGIEVTTRCNLKCQICYRNFIDDLPRRDLKPSILEKALREFSSAEIVDFVGLGEPFLNPHIFELISMVKEDYRKVRLTTNGTLIDARKAEELVNLSIDEVSFSIDGSKQIHNDIKDGSYDRCIKGLENLTDARGDTKIPRIQVQTLITKQNVSKLGELRDTLEQFRVDEWSLFHPFCLSEEAWDFHLMGKEKGEIVIPGIESENLEVHVRRSVSNPIEEHCYDPWNVVYITANGKVKPCCFLGTLPSKFKEYFHDSEIFVNAEGYKMGEIGNGDIWNSNSYRELRKYLSQIGQVRNLLIEDYNALRKQHKLEGRFSYCAICQNRFGVAC